MTPERAKGLLPILEHIANGGSDVDIEQRLVDDNWKPFDGLFATHCDWSYRIKPKPLEPLELWVNVYDNGVRHAHDKPEFAAEALQKNGHTVHMREVCDD